MKTRSNCPGLHAERCGSISTRQFLPHHENEQLVVGLIKRCCCVQHDSQITPSIKLTCLVDQRVDPCRSPLGLASKSGHATHLAPTMIAQNVRRDSEQPRPLGAETFIEAIGVLHYATKRLSNYVIGRTAADATRRIPMEVSGVGQVQTTRRLASVANVLLVLRQQPHVRYLPAAIRLFEDSSAGSTLGHRRLTPSAYAA